MTESLLAIGADGARGGWLAALGYGSGDVERIELVLAPTFTELCKLRTSEAPVAVDIPMGLLDSPGLRPCDQHARVNLRHRASTVFAPPSRPLLEAATYTEARALIEAARVSAPQTKSISAQAFGIAPKVREADEFLTARPDTQRWLFECHPELSFRALADGELLPAKKSVAGSARRFQLVLGRFPSALDALTAFDAFSSQAELVDALDALAALDTALHVRAGDHEELGGERDGENLLMRMVF